MMLSIVWDGVVDEEKWQLVQQLLKKNSKTRGNSVSEDVQHDYLLLGLVHCTHCGIVLENGSGTSHTGKSYFYYRHPSKKRKKDCPYPTSFPIDELEIIVGKQVLGLVHQDDRLLEDICSEVEKTLNKDCNQLQLQLDLVEQDLATLNCEASGLVNRLSYLDEQQIREFVTPRLNEISCCKKKLEEQKQALISEVLTFKNGLVSVDDIRYTVSVAMESFYEVSSKEQKRVLEELIEKVEIYPQRVVVVMKAQKHSSRFEECTNWLSR
ncbi:zinc ribbon domain-containing protein [Candidatus Uabimicrobium sp. HlEnr_7]|uniref:zinc ribbon domain-containing protein n=1 Tax=Candidatus Uabimicrobium helgolandensis TaxID=3095367 RepID=UPI00355725E5